MFLLFLLSFPVDSAIKHTIVRFVVTDLQSTPFSDYLTEGRSESLTLAQIDETVKPTILEYAQYISSKSMMTMKLQKLGYIELEWEEPEELSQAAGKDSKRDAKSGLPKLTYKPDQRGAGLDPFSESVIVSARRLKVIQVDERSREPTLTAEGLLSFPAMAEFPCVCCVNADDRLDKLKQLVVPAQESDKAYEVRSLSNWIGMILDEMAIKTQAKEVELYGDTIREIKRQIKKVAKKGLVDDFYGGRVKSIHAVFLDKRKWPSFLTKHDPHQSKSGRRFLGHEFIGIHVVVLVGGSQFDILDVFCPAERELYQVASKFKLEVNSKIEFSLRKFQPEYQQVVAEQVRKQFEGMSHLDVTSMKQQSSKFNYAAVVTSSPAQSDIEDGEEDETDAGDQGLLLKFLCDRFVEARPGVNVLKECTDEAVDTSMTNPSDF